ncbi:MAG TPA: hypothetical protein VGO52_03835 [Hyphomonadaceae bacterium]|jgi:hypothetical protein|nr:hypothetical protein [Hyphomonadaceae bacterium]
MGEQLTPEAAREALAQADRMAQAGHRRAWWPRWAMAVGSLLLGAMIVVSGLPETRIGSAGAPLLLLAFIAGLAFRMWCIRKYGAVARPNAIDATMMLVLILCVVGAWVLPKIYGLMWGPWVMGAGYAALRMIRYEFGRRGAPAAMAQDGKA